MTTAESGIILVDMIKAAGSFQAHTVIIHTRVSNLIAAKECHLETVQHAH